ncbi:uncharacterized protein SCHCODRAFT_02593921 [Schizophyllum commune H4-8]|nr:uncharacterized protein SCHCODRAFT_02593921 [Schizophyllum commune H4-8]KAI5885385.1 hypothetical protein SCHCODRAFT_02593921 [Schizophyllum commune H4-8]
MQGAVDSTNMPYNATYPADVDPPPESPPPTYAQATGSPERRGIYSRVRTRIRSLSHSGPRPQPRNDPAHASVPQMPQHILDQLYALGQLPSFVVQRSQISPDAMFDSSRSSSHSPSFPMPHRDSNVAPSREGSVDSQPDITFPEPEFPQEITFPVPEISDSAYADVLARNVAPLNIRPKSYHNTPDSTADDDTPAFPPPSLTHVRIKSELRSKASIYLSLAIGPQQSERYKRFEEYMNALASNARRHPLANANTTCDEKTALAFDTLYHKPSFYFKELSIVLRHTIVRGGIFHGQDAFRAVLGHLTHLLPSFRTVTVRFEAEGDIEADSLDDPYSDFQGCFTGLQRLCLLFHGGTDNLIARLSAFPLHSLQKLLLTGKMSEADVIWILSQPRPHRLNKLSVRTLLYDGDLEQPLSPKQRRKLKWPERLIITAQRVPTFLGIVPRKCEFTLKLPAADAAVQRLFDGEVMPRWTLIVDPRIGGEDSV